MDSRVLLLCFLSALYQQAATSTDPDAFLPVPAIIGRRGYPVEVHHVETEDGYILEMHRIPGPGRPVLVLHGLMDSSASWVINPGTPLGFMLADAGYDVWLGNNRGNRYSRRHVAFSTNSRRFWEFTADSYAKYDNPAMIDYILGHTGYPDLYYIGHSSSTWSFWAMMNHKPYMNDRVRLMVGLGPVATMGYWSTVLRLAVPFRNLLHKIAQTWGQYEVGGHEDYYPKLAHIFCSEYSLTVPLCGLVLNVIAGWNPGQLDKSSLARIFSHVPAGNGGKVLLQFSQHVASGRFQHFDHGVEGNLAVYGRPTPPLYYPEAVTAPVLLLWGENDKMADKRDVALLAARLPNLVASLAVAWPLWQHLDFLWGVDADRLVYWPIVRYFQHFDELDYTLEPDTYSFRASSAVSDRNSTVQSPAVSDKNSTVKSPAVH